VPLGGRVIKAARSQRWGKGRDKGAETMIGEEEEEEKRREIASSI
jgi:hypothetical protein